MSTRSTDMNPLNSITSILGVILFLVILYYIAKGFFFILGLITPVLLIAAAILNWQVYPDYVKWIWNQLKTNPLMGILAVILSVVALPVVSGFLFLKALYRYRLKKMGVDMERRDSEDYVDFEILEEDTDNSLELPEIEKEAQKKNEYDGLFDELG